MRSQSMEEEAIYNNLKIDHCLVCKQIDKFAHQFVWRSGRRPTKCSILRPKFVDDHSIILNGDMHMSLCELLREGEREGCKETPVRGKPVSNDCGVAMMAVGLLDGGGGSGDVVAAIDGWMDCCESLL